MHLDGILYLVVVESTIIHDFDTYLMTSNLFCSSVSFFGKLSECDIARCVPLYNLYSATT